MAIPGKWIKGISPESDVSDAARLSLLARLDAVRQLLPPAALQADEDVEHVHRLRVSTRRAVAAIELYADFLPPKKSQRMLRRLKRIRKAAGVARDLDVLSERLQDVFGDGMSALAGDITRQRAAAQPAIVAAYESALRDGRWERWTSKLVKRTRPRRKRDRRPEMATMAPWAQRRLRHISQRFFQAEPNNPRDFRALHQFRLSGKELRYALELLKSAFPAQLCEAAYPLVEQLQDHLGSINDHVCGAQRLENWQAAASEPAEETFLAKLAIREHERLEAALEEFWQWWKGGVRRELSDMLLDDAKQSPSPSNDGLAQPA